MDGKYPTEADQSLADKALFAMLAVFIFGSMVFTFYKYTVKRDYVFRQEVLCDSENVPEGEYCNNPEQYKIDNPTEECDPDDEECLSEQEEECAPDDQECLDAQESECDPDDEECLSEEVECNSEDPADCEEAPEDEAEENIFIKDGENDNSGQKEDTNMNVPPSGVEPM